MREVLFRGKDDCGIWRYGHLVVLVDIGLCIADEPLVANDYGEICKQTYSVVAPETIGQHTGMMDKNGTWIYEGDILRCEFDTTVVFDQGAFQAHKNGGLAPLRYFPLISCDKMQAEIVGNIYDQGVNGAMEGGGGDDQA